MSDEITNDAAPATTLPDEVQFDVASLNAEFVRVPGDMAYWTTRLADTAVELLNAKSAIEELDAGLLVSYSDKYPRGNVAYIRSRVLLDVRRKNLKDRLIGLQGDKIQLEGVLSSIRAKREALITIGANHRAELHANVTSINTQTHGQRQRALEAKYTSPTTEEDL